MYKFPHNSFGYANFSPYFSGIVSSKTKYIMAKKPKPLDLATLQVEYDLILATLKKVDFDKAKAARLLNVDRKTINNKLKQYRIYFLTEETQSA